MRPRFHRRNTGLGRKTDGLVNADSIRSQVDDVFDHEFEAATVVDIILDNEHPDLYDKTVDVDFTPTTSKGAPPSGADLSRIGCALVRPVESRKNADRESLIWAYPLDSATTQYPLINEIVSVVNYLGRWYYSPQINFDNRVNSNCNPAIEYMVGDGFKGLIRDSSNPKAPYKGVKSVIGSEGSEPRYQGFTGKYFIFNNKIRRLKRFEGDTILEGRFGNSIRFGAYENNKAKDVGLPPDYAGGGGNPSILIRNRQRPVAKIPEGKAGIKKGPDPTAGANIGFEDHFNSVMTENVNWDGSSIHITSGKTESLFNPQLHFIKAWFSAGNEEQKKYSTPDSTTWKFPKLDGDQIVINSSRLLFSARDSELLAFSKKHMQFTTDDEFCIDSHDQIVLTTNQKTVLNSPFIYLGEYDQTKEPAILGETMIEWLYELGEWLKSHRHNYDHEHTHSHSHPDAGSASPPETGSPTDSFSDFDAIVTQTPIEVHVKALEALVQKLPETLSKRVFLTGGGHALGQDGGEAQGLGAPASLGKVPGGYWVKKAGEFEGKIGPKRTSAK
jgi:hypothetical protein